MALAVCLLFDAPGERLIRRLWARLEERGVPTLLTHTHRRHRAHLSLAVARSWDLESLAAALNGIPLAEPRAVSFPGVVAFTRGRAALAAGVDAGLARTQQSVAEAVLHSGADLHHNYLPGRWVPHVSLSTGGTADRLPLISAVVNDALPLTVAVAGAALIDSGTGRLWPWPD
jgi:hypothetical protein